jgi:hypothetical protein
MDHQKSRYWLFAGDCYYASGGMHDFRGAFASSELAQQHTFFEWWHVWNEQFPRIGPTHNCTVAGVEGTHAK